MPLHLWATAVGDQMNSPGLCRAFLAGHHTPEKDHAHDNDYKNARNASVAITHHYLQTC